MQIELTFTNRGTDRISDARDVYVEIDDDAGHNYLRRLLPAVDFRKLVPGQPLKLSMRILSGAFRPSHYTIYLWIPSADPSLKFKPEHNFLLSGAGVADFLTGLNKIAEFAVAPAARKGRSPR